MNKTQFNDFKLLLFLIGMMWCIEITHHIAPEQLKVLALLPREVGRLYAIISMHFLHWGFSHLIANTLPLLVLGFLLCATGKAKQVTLWLIVCSGLLVWIFARPGAHAGASAMVMGFWGFLLSHAFFERNLKNILISILTFIFYGGIFFSLVDFRETTSFEGHIFGFIAGIVSARLFGAQRS